MSFSSLLVLVSILLLVFFLYTELFHPAVSFFLTISILLAFGVISVQDVLNGFSNKQVALIVVLVVVSSVIKKYNLLGYFFEALVGRAGSYREFILRLTSLVSFLSAFLNNTPIVSTLLPYVKEWGDKRGIPPSKLLIPLSYSAILGGTVTLIGTSTNLLVNALNVENGLRPFGLFTFSLVGLPATFLGVLYLTLFGWKLLPSRKDFIEEFYLTAKNFLVETVVPLNSKLSGKSVEEVGLRSLPGLFLVEIIRRDEKIAPVSPETKLLSGDCLIFAGDTERIAELLTKFQGSLSLPGIDFNGCSKIELVEALVPLNSSLINKRVKETDFRAKFDAAIIAVYRKGEKLTGRIGDIVLKPGDLLLLIPGKDFFKRISDSEELLLLKKVERELLPEKERRKAFFFFFLFIFSVFLSQLLKLSLLKLLLILLSLMVVFKVLTYSEVKSRIDLNLVVIAAFSLSLGKAIVSSGLSSSLTTLLIGFSASPLVALIFLYFLTNLLTEFITNLGAAAIAYPFALSIASKLSLPPEPFTLTVAFAASASFLTPIGYQTNLLVFSAGRYKFSDYVKVGLPLSLTYMFLTVSLLFFKYGLGG
ncbi:SLC13 family permease [Thermovibrio sp.]